MGKPLKAITKAVDKFLFGAQTPISNALGLGGTPKPAAAAPPAPAPPEPAQLAPPPPAPAAPPPPPPTITPVAPPPPPSADPAKAPAAAAAVVEAGRAARTVGSRAKTLFTGSDFLGVEDGAKDLSAEKKVKRPRNRTLYGAGS